MVIGCEKPSRQIPSMCDRAIVPFKSAPCATPNPHRAPPLIINLRCRLPPACRAFQPVQTSCPPSNGRKAWHWLSRRTRRAGCWMFPMRPPSKDGANRAILAAGLQVGLRPAEIAALKVGDLHQNCGYDSQRLVRKGGRRDALRHSPQDRRPALPCYLDLPVTAATSTAPVRPRSHNRNRQETRLAMHSDAIDRVLRTLTARIALAVARRGRLVKLQSRPGMTGIRGAAVGSTLPKLGTRGSD